MTTKGERILKSLKRFTDDLESGKPIPSKYNCRTIKLNLEPQEYNKDLVKQTREILGASQAIFAQFLGVSVSTIQDWEQGRTSPKDVACRLMDEIRTNPDYWINRLKELSVCKNEETAGC